MHSLSILAGRSYGKVDILCHNYDTKCQLSHYFNINTRVMKVRAGQVLRCAPFHHIKRWLGIRQCNLHKIQDFFLTIKYKILCFLPLSCVQIVPVGSLGSVALLLTCDVTGHIVYSMRYCMRPGICAWGAKGIQLKYQHLLQRRLDHTVVVLITKTRRTVMCMPTFNLLMVMDNILKDLGTFCNTEHNVHIFKLNSLVWR